MSEERSLTVRDQREEIWESAKQIAADEQVHVLLHDLFADEVYKWMVDVESWVERGYPARPQLKVIRKEAGDAADYLLGLNPVTLDLITISLRVLFERRVEPSELDAPVDSAWRMRLTELHEYEFGRILAEQCERFVEREKHWGGKSRWQKDLVCVLRTCHVAINRQQNGAVIRLLELATDKVPGFGEKLDIPEGALERQQRLDGIAQLVHQQEKST